MTLKMIVAEDEQSFREGILTLVDWKLYGIEIAGEAENGRQALEMIHNDPPDLLLTDIRMPHLNGLDLIREAKAAGHEFRSVLLTGYNEFEYAKEAIKLGVSDYLLKPCTPHDIVRVIFDLKQKIEASENEDKAVNALNQSWNRNIHLLKNQILSQWIQQPLMPLENRGSVLREIDMALLPRPIQVGIIRIDASVRPNAAASKRDLELIRYALLNITGETLRPLYEGRLEVFRHGDEMLWVGNYPECASHDAVESAMRMLQHNLEAYLKLSISISISSAQASVDFAHIGFQEALHAMEGRFYQGRGGIFFYAGADKQQAAKTSILEDAFLNRLEKELLFSLQNEQYEQAVDAIEASMCHIRASSSYSKAEVHLRSTSLILELQKFAKERKVASIEWQDSFVNWMEQIPNMETLDECTVVLQKIVQSIVEAVSNQKSLHRTVHATIELIKQRYNTNLTLELAAKETFVSNSYLSSLFKQELGVNFLDYLHQYRVEQSKEWLRQSYKIYAVSKLVGYQEERHFSSTFKKWTGLTPRQYQKNYNAE
ncbi:two-component system response regulator YesN [Paenibacillus endophyticus]|uniref:Two-component system response regulator YesN n=1 Tax=Paenibacillus endophyticus TaxID=1294268 RepID=A0A7W5CBG2_9BACL|nr:response regulator [Paenibacillus endophyticus]MBB3154109.1 two-component system response regulator YesN [Paenibacillus endophyticus]